jgi:hypothetical protein
MSYQIVRISPVYCQITDAMIGSKATHLPYAYHNKEYAMKLAACMTDEAYLECGDFHFVVVEYGKSAYSSRRVRTNPVIWNYDFDDEIPF